MPGIPWASIMKVAQAGGQVWRLESPWHHPSTTNRPLPDSLSSPCQFEGRIPLLPRSVMCMVASGQVHATHRRMTTDASVPSAHSTGSSTPTVMCGDSCFILTVSRHDYHRGVCSWTARLTWLSDPGHCPGSSGPSHLGY